MKRNKEGKRIKFTLEEYIARLPEHHRNTFDYSDSEYQGGGEPITFRCPQHGIQTYPKADKHKTSPYGCKLCGKEALYKEKVRQGKERFLKGFRDNYGATYDLSYTTYEKVHLSCDFFCKEHGLFRDKPRDAIKRHPCTVCRKRVSRLVNRKPIVDVVEESLSKFGKEFGFDFTNYTHCHSVIGIKCPVHGWDEVRLSNHLCSTTGCSKCYKESDKTAHNRVPPEESVKRLLGLYGNDYHFFTEDIKTGIDKVRYYCSKHKKLYTTQLRHLWDGHACRDCGKDRGKLKLTGFYNTTTMERSKDFYKKDLNNLYFISLEGGRYKVGLAKDIYSRMHCIKSESSISPTVITALKGNTYDLFYKEQELLNAYSDCKYLYDKPFKGYTEVVELDEDQVKDIKLDIHKGELDE